MEAGFADSLSDTTAAMSLEDQQALKIMEQSVTMSDGKYQVELPWKNTPDCLPINRSVAETRLHYLKKRLLKDETLRQSYTKTVQDYITKGHAKELHDVTSPSAWYLPHHPVENPNKPDKVRIVFDCSAQHHGASLNDQLLQGQDL